MYFTGGENSGTEANNITGSTSDNTCSMYFIGRETSATEANNTMGSTSDDKTVTENIIESQCDNEPPPSTSKVRCLLTITAMAQCMI